jgi:hypothetical protein
LDYSTLFYKPVFIHISYFQVPHAYSGESENPQHTSPTPSCPCVVLIVPIYTSASARRVARVQEHLRGKAVGTASWFLVFEFRTSPESHCGTGSRSAQVNSLTRAPCRRIALVHSPGARKREMRGARECRRACRLRRVRLGEVSIGIAKVVRVV